MKVDVFKKCKMVKPVVCGLVMKITSPKGIREFREETQLYHYNLHTDLKQIYDGKATELQPGLYWVVDIAKTRDLGIHWNHYILNVTEDNVELLESYLNENSTDWIPQALPTIKQYLGSKAD